MEKVTLDTVLERLDRLEKGINDLNEKVSVLVDPVVKQNQDELRTGEQVMAYFGNNKDQHTKLVREVFEIMGINGEPIPAEELQERMEKSGIRPVDNEFSRAIIEERYR